MSADRTSLLRCLGLLLAMTAATGCSFVPDHAASEREPLAAHASLLLDRDAALDATAAQRQVAAGAFRRLRPHEARFGYTRARVWLLLHPPPALSATNAFVVALEPALLDEVVLYRFRDGRLVEQLSHDPGRPLKERPVSLRGAGFRIVGHDPDHEQLLLSARSAGNLALNGWFMPEAVVPEHRIQRALQDAVFLGAILPLVVLNLLLFAFLRTRSLLFLSLFGGATAAHHILGQDLLVTLAPGLVTAPAHGFYLGAMLTSGLAAMLFTRHALILPRANPLLDRVVVGFTLLIGLALLALPLLSVRTLYPIALALSLAGTAVLLLAAAIRWRQGDPSARILTFTWSVLLLGVLLMAAYRSGWLGTPILIERDAYLLSAACVLLLTFAVIQRLLVLGHPDTAVDAKMSAAVEAAQEGDRMIGELERRLHHHNRELRVVNERLASVSSETERHAQTLSALFASSVAIHRTDDIEELLRTSLGQLGELFPDHGFGIIIHGDRQGDVRYRAFLRIEPELQQLLTSNAQLLGESVRSTLRSLLLASGSSNTVSANQTQHGGWQFLEMPDRRRQAYGHLIIQGADLAPRSVEVLSVFCSQISTAIENRRLSRELEELANTDPLTGIANRKVLDAALADALRNATSSPQIEFCVLVIDVNSLKPVNDTFGHETGDRVIVHVARVLAECVRREDTLARMGGDEFVVLCPNTHPDGAEELAGRIHRTLSQHDLVLHDAAGAEVIYRATVAIGIASSLDAPPEQVLAVADTRMYDAKERHYATMAARAEG